MYSILFIYNHIQKKKKEKKKLKTIIIFNF